MQGDLAVLARKVMPEDIQQGFQEFGNAMASIPHGRTAPQGYVPGPGGYYASGSTAGLLVRQILGDRAVNGLEDPQAAVQRLSEKGQFDPRAVIHHAMLTGMMQK